MKLFWKQFIGISCLILLVFCLSGSLLLYSSFQMSLTEEKNRITEEISIFQYAILSSLQNLPEEYEAVDYAVGQIGESIVESRGNEQDVVRIYQENAKTVYESRQNSPNHTADNQDEIVIWMEYIKENQNAWEDRQGLYQIERDGNEYFLRSLSVLNSPRGRFFLEINRNINYIYKNRESLYKQYQGVLILMIVPSLLLSWVFSFCFTRPIQRLSKGTKRFADGDYTSRVRLSGNDEVTVLIHDFNEMAERLSENMEQLKEHARKQEEFTAAFAHELKTPLTSIVGYADMLRMMELSEEDRLMCGDYIFKQGTRLEKLSYKMLELVGMDKHKISFCPISVTEIVAKAVKIMEISLNQKHLICKQELTEGYFFGDEDLILSLLCNLMDNSRKACKEGGTIAWQGVIEDRTYVLSLRDDGEGIPAADLERIKEAFYMVDKSRARKEGGAGIGMALCDKIIKLHKGTWSIESTLSEGTLVRLRFALSKKLEEEKNE